MLAGDRDRPGDRNRHRATQRNGAVENRVNPAQEGSTERWEAIADQLIERLALINSADIDLGTTQVGIGHGAQFRSYSNCFRKLSICCFSSMTSCSSAPK